MTRKSTFRESFDSYCCDGDTITTKVGKLTITARIVHDDNMGPPWEENDGHGPVSDWTDRAKQPGERVLCENRGSKRYYDFAEAVRIARRDGWDATPYNAGTAGERAARAAELDFQAMQAWCRDDWWWVGVVLSVEKAGVVLDEHAASLWGIECNYPGGDNSYLTEIANELLPEALEAGREALEAVTA